ncbi:alpha-1-inhibitor 3-like [Penaeus japonicus]|uniref:alpha-1-inhibitor 3-like n=1 Tax=Penaeus japonicus TaxID=27405 RepID=UPI001C70E39B|nr:alpha-1-inhibitor 3-like [Penaeus japonicus]
MRPQEINCTEIPGTCCSDWICGDLPRKCVLETGETYEIGESWINDCEVCQCVHSTRGARASCHKLFCIPPPHYACLEVERPGECCPDYNCASTTCKFEGRYYRIGDKITSEDYCQTCVCEKGEPVAVLECDEPTTCEDPPSPECLPAYADGQCCPIGWDCTDVYLMTVPKVGVRGGQSSVCVFLEEEPLVEVKLNLSLTFGREEVAVEIDERASESVICTEISIPAGDSDVTAILSVEGTIGTVAVSEELPIRLVSVSKTFVQTDKYLYEEGQAVKFRVLSVEGAEAAISYENLEEVWITSPANTRLAQWRDVNNSLGLVQLEFPLAEQVKEGDYTIHVKTGGRVTKKNFKVEPYTLPRFIVTVIPPPYTLVTDDIIKVTVCADYTYGQPVTGSGILRVKKNRYYYYENDQEKDVLNIEIPTFTGCADVDVDTSQINTEGFGFIGKLLLTANVTEEGTELVVSGSASIQLATKLLSFTLISRGKDAKPGLPFEMQIQARYPDDTGAPDVEVAACVETTCKDFTTDGEGVFTVIVPPHLVKPQGYLKVSLTDEGNNKGNLGILHPSSHYFNFDLYYSKSNSSLSLAIPTDALACTSSQDISLSLPVSFVANNMARALMRVQVMSRSQVVLTQSFEQDLTASPLNFDNDLLLAPMEDLEAGFVRGTFDLQLDIPHYASPTVRVLIWYSTGDGEVIAASGSVEVSSCLPNTASLSWSPSDIAAPKDEVEVTITSAPNSICGLGVVDRSVEILSRGKAGSLTKDSVFNIFKNTEPNHWLNSQVDDYSYCSGNPFPPFYDYFGMEEFRRKRSYYRPHYSLYIDALSAFNDAAFLVISDLTIQTRPCEKQDFGGFFPIGIGDVFYAEDGAVAGSDYGAGADYAAGGEITEEEAAAPPPLLEEDTPSEDVDVNKEVDEGDEEEARTYFPETWLWDLVVVGDTGSSSVPVVVPDTVTEWVGEAVCVNPTFGIGLSPPTTLTAFTPFFLDLTMPPSVRRQERVPLRVSVFNYLDQTLPVSVTLTESPSFTANEYSQSVCVPANSMEVAEYIVVPSEAGDINLTFSASVTSASAQCSAGSDLPEKSDVMVKALKVVFEGVERERVNSVFICGGDDSQTWNLETPAGVIEGSERVFVSVSADLLGPTIENLGHLVNMPYGCGEQNMINFVPNIYVVQYLDSIDQGDTEIVDKAINFMTIGYQKELNYRREDGSYSAFGDSDSEGSTWLTAYVLKSFAQASEYITIDEEDLEVSADWLLNQQMEDGCFESVGMVHHKAMKGGLGSTTSSAVPLSAYVIIALSEAGEDASLSSAVSCVTADTAAVDVYSESLKSYALALSSPADAPGHITAAYDLLIADAEVEGSIWVESASYTVLAMLKADPTAYAAQSVDLVRRISQHRNSLGAFHSTQDSVLALQAFAAYSKAFPASDTNLELEVTAETSFSMQITTANQLVVQTRDIEDTLPYNVTVTPSGTGCAVFMVVHQFHIPEIAASSTFDMTVTSTSESCIFANVTICVSYLVVGEDSNMVIIEVDLESGYVAIEHDLERLQNKGVIKKYEQDEPGLVELYLESVTAKEVCLTVGVVRVIWVEDVKPGTVSIYDYYQNPDNKLVKPLVIQRPDCVVMGDIQEAR